MPRFDRLVTVAPDLDGCAAAQSFGRQREAALGDRCDERLAEPGLHFSERHTILGARRPGEARLDTAKV